jgi:hypothetical protein
MDPNTIKQGYLEKRNRNGKWQQRHFIIDKNRALRYAKESASCTSDSASKQIRFNPGTRVEVVDDHTTLSKIIRLRGIQRQGSDRQVCELRVENHRVNEWVAVFNNAVSNQDGMRDPKWPGVNEQVSPLRVPPAQSSLPPASVGPNATMFTDDASLPHGDSNQEGQPLNKNELSVLKAIQAAFPGDFFVCSLER